MTPVTIEQVAAIVGLTGTGGAAVLWLLGREFVKRPQVTAVYRKIEENEVHHAKRVAAVEERVNALATRHEVSAETMSQLSTDISEIKTMLRERLDRLDERVQSHGERLAAVERRKR